MASIAQANLNRVPQLEWLLYFLKQELTPYRGRTELVARMVISTTIMMLISMTFQMPFGAFGAIFAVIMPRESVGAVRSEVLNIVAGLAFAEAFIITGLTVALSDPALRFVWIVTGFFIAFWAMSAFRTFSPALQFVYLIAITVGLWDSRIPPSKKVESALWAAGVLTLASLVCLAVEIIFQWLRRSNDLFDPLLECLVCVEETLLSYSEGRADRPAIANTISRLAMTGTSRMRQTLVRSNSDPQYAAQMGAVVALTGRLVDLAANLPHLAREVPQQCDREWIAKIVRRLTEIRQALLNASIPIIPGPQDDCSPEPGLPLLHEIEQTVLLIPYAFTNAEALRLFSPSQQKQSASAQPLLFAALLDPEHIKFAIRGCLAATSSYVIYTALFWPEISTAVTTCILTALTTIGASRQKQFLRFAGALIGGLVIGMGAQIFILPYIDSIAGFTLLFVAVMTIACWISTSSPRLSYLGVQIAVAFCLINLLEYKFQTSLTVARDRVIGVLLGLSMMWLFFDQLWSRPAGVAMRRDFANAILLLAQLARGPRVADVGEAIEASYRLRDAVASYFDNVRALADGVLFEFGPSRNDDLEFRDRIRAWQPSLRALFVLRIAALKYRLQSPGFELPEPVQTAQRAYDDASAEILDDLASRITTPTLQSGADGRKEMLERLRLEAEKAADREIQGARALSFISLLREIDSVTSVLSEQMAPGLLR